MAAGETGSGAYYYEDCALVFSPQILDQLDFYVSHEDIFGLHLISRSSALRSDRRRLAHYFRQIG